MSRVMRTIDAKSFIIGVLSAVIVVMAMGAQRANTNWGRPYLSPWVDYEAGGQITKIYQTSSDGVKQVGTVDGTPFGVAGTGILYWKRSPIIDGFSPNNS